MLAIPVLMETRIPGLLFQDVCVGPGKRFRPDACRICLMTIFRPADMLWHRRRVMLEAILFLLGIGSCALVLIAIWGSNLLGNDGVGSARPLSCVPAQKTA